MLRLSLRYKLLIGALALLLPVLGLLLLSVQAEAQQRRERALDEQVRTARSIAALVDTIFDDSIDLGRALASDPVVRSLDPALADPHLRRLAPSYPQYLHLAVFNANGDDVGTSFPGAVGEPRVNMAQFEFFQQAMATGQPVVSEVRRAFRDERPVVVVVVPIVDGGRPIGTVHLVHDLSHLPRRLAGLLQRPGDATFVVDPRGRIAFHSARPDLSWEQRDVSGLPEVRAALAGQTERSDNFASPLLGEVRWLGAVRSPRHGWVAAFTQSPETVYAPLEEQAQRELAAFALIVLFGIGGAWTLSRLLIGPLARLAEMARAFGRGDLGRRADVRTRDEIEDLGEAFNSMAERLQAALGALRESEERFRSILQTAVSVIIMLSPDHRILEFNPEAERLYGVKREDVLGQDYFARFLPAEVQGAVAADMEKVLAGEPTRGFENEVTAADGSRYVLSWSVNRVLDGQGRPVGVVAVGLDISERRRAEEALQHSLGLLQTVFEATTDALFVKDRQSRYVMVNAATVGIIGKPVEEIIGRDDTALFPPEAARRFMADDRRVLAGEEVEAVEDVPTAAGGTRIYFTKKAAYRDRRGNVVGLIGIARDITERRQAEQERERLLQQLASERSWLRTVIDRSPVGILLLEGARGERITANRRAEEIFGYSVQPEGGREQFAGHVRYPDGRPASIDELAGSRALQGETVMTEEFLIRRPDGRDVPALVNAGPIRDRAGTVLGAVVLFDDISRLKELERQREEWTSVIAHDLRQPVTVITGYAGLLAKQVEREAPQLKPKVDHILASVCHLNRMIADLLDVSRIEARRLTVERQPVDLPALVRAIVERTAAVTRGHPVRAVIEGEIPRLQVDPGRLEQVLGNLLSNAAKYGYPNTEIRVEVARRNGEVQVSVSNQGRGIPDEDLPRLFTRFHRTRWAKEERVAGLGLGLYITKGLVEAHDGRIWAESIPGQTTTFHFTLPARAATAAAA